MSGGVLVVGSLNVDVTSFSERLPRPGETVLGTAVSLVAGGKGANQALASARAGAPTWMVGRVGDDVFARVLLDALVADGVDVTHVSAVGAGTGMAHIRVDASGQNDIVVVPRANAELGTEQVDTALSTTGAALSVVLLQLEIPLAVVRYVARAARAVGLTVVLDPAPARRLDEAVWANVDVVTPNETEAEALTGVPVRDRRSAQRAARWFLERGARHVVVTLGELGALWVGPTGSRSFPAYQVRPVDTTAAGDAFTGTLGAAIANGLEVSRAVERAMAAGALAVTRPGASSSLPRAAEVDALLRSSP